MSEPELTTVPDEWKEELRLALSDPKGWDGRLRAHRDTVYDRFRARIWAHSKTRREHEADMWLSVYVVYYFELWRAEFDSWDDFLMSFEREAEGEPAGTVNYKMVVIRRLMDKGASYEAIRASIAAVPMATAELATATREAVPGDINKALAEISSQSPRDALVTVKDWKGEPTIKAMAADWDGKTLLLKVRVKPPDTVTPTYDRDLVIPLDDADIAHWMFHRLGVVKFWKEKL